MIILKKGNITLPFLQLNCLSVQLLVAIRVKEFIQIRLQFRKKS